jgi:hypothetical protein
MSVQTPLEHPNTREEYIEWLSHSAPRFISHGKTIDELEVMSDNELTQLYDTVLGIFYLG